MLKKRYYLCRTRHKAFIGQQDTVRCCARVRRSHVGDSAAWAWSRRCGLPQVKSVLVEELEDVCAAAGPSATSDCSHVSKTLMSRVWKVNECKEVVKLIFAPPFCCCSRRGRSCFFGFMMNLTSSRNTHLYLLYWHLHILTSCRV